MKKAGLVGVMVVLLAAWASAQTLSNLDRDRAQGMLKVVGDEVRKHYYDPKFHGVNWDASLDDAKEKIGKAPSFGMALSNIAAASDTLNDSHTFFLPPQHVARTDYGFQYQMVGDRCFVTHVRPKSDAETKGVKPGDQIVAINGYNVDSGQFVEDAVCVFGLLRPQPGLRSADCRIRRDIQRTVDAASKIRQGKKVTDLTGEGGGGDIWDLIRQEETEDHLMRAQYLEIGDQLMVLKVPEFFFSIGEVEKMIGKARKHQSLIVDLRGNGGGAIDTLKFLIGGVFDKEVKVADRVGRKDSKPEVAKTLHNPFTGKLVVLVDSKSASASELFARVIQLEKRGTVIGDRSSGSVMEARHYDEKMGSDTVVFYGASITEWDLIMADGKAWNIRE